MEIYGRDEFIQGSSIQRGVNENLNGRIATPSSSYVYPVNLTETSLRLEIMAKQLMAQSDKSDT